MTGTNRRGQSFVPFSAMVRNLSFALRPVRSPGGLHAEGWPNQLCISGSSHCSKEMRVRDGQCGC